MAGGHGQAFGGVFDIRRDRMRVFRAGQERRSDNDDFIEGLSNPEIGRRFGSAFEQASGEIELINEAAPAFDRAQFLAGKQTPVFFGSAINNFGVQEVLDALVEQAPPPGSAHRAATRGAARGTQVHRRGVQGAGQHGPRAPRPRRLRARELRPLRSAACA